MRIELLLWESALQMHNEGYFEKSFDESCKQLFR
jgi:hypothetical protein